MQRVKHQEILTSVLMAWRVGRQGNRNTLKDNDCKLSKRMKRITVDSVRPVNTKYKFKNI